MRVYNFDLKMKLHSYHFLKTKTERKKKSMKTEKNIVILKLITAGMQ